MMLNPGDKCTSCGYVMKAVPKREDPRDFMTPEDKRKVAEFLDEPCEVCGKALRYCACELEDAEA